MSIFQIEFANRENWNSNRNTKFKKCNIRIANKNIYFLRKVKINVIFLCIVYFIIASNYKDNTCEKLMRILNLKTTF